jgi:hypothetical protein
LTSRRYKKNRKRKQVISEKGTRKKDVSTSKVSTTRARNTIKIPEKSKIYDYLMVDNHNGDGPIWRRLDMILAQAQLNKEANAKRMFDAFVKGISVYYPEKEKAFSNLWPHILRHIIQGETLSINYYMELSEE